MTGLAAAMLTAAATEEVGTSMVGHRRTEVTRRGYERANADRRDFISLTNINRSKAHMPIANSGSRSACPADRQPWRQAPAVGGRG